MWLAYSGGYQLDRSSGRGSVRTRWHSAHWTRSKNPPRPSRWSVAVRSVFPLVEPQMSQTSDSSESLMEGLNRRVGSSNGCLCGLRSRWIRGVRGSPARRTDGSRGRCVRRFSRHLPRIDPTSVEGLRAGARSPVLVGVPGNGRTNGALPVFSVDGHRRSWRHRVPPVLRTRPRHCQPADHLTHQQRRPSRLALHTETRRFAGTTWAIIERSGSGRTIPTSPRDPVQGVLPSTRSTPRGSSE